MSYDPPMPHIVHLDRDGQRVEFKWDPLTGQRLPAPEHIASCELQFNGDDCYILVTQPGSAWNILGGTVRGWNATNREDNQRLDFLGELVRRLVAASSGQTALEKGIKVAIFDQTIADCWAKKPEPATTSQEP